MLWWRNQTAETWWRCPALTLADMGMIQNTLKFGRTVRECKTLFSGNARGSRAWTALWLLFSYNSTLDKVWPKSTKTVVGSGWFESWFFADLSNSRLLPAAGSSCLQTALEPLWNCWGHAVFNSWLKLAHQYETGGWKAAALGYHKGQVEQSTASYGATAGRHWLLSNGESDVGTDELGVSEQAG